MPDCDFYVKKDTFASNFYKEVISKVPSSILVPRKFRRTTPLYSGTNKNPGPEDLSGRTPEMLLDPEGDRPDIIALKTREEGVFTECDPWTYRELSDGRVVRNQYGKVKVEVFEKSASGKSYEITQVHTYSSDIRDVTLGGYVKVDTGGIWDDARSVKIAII